MIVCGQFSQGRTAVGWFDIFGSADALGYMLWRDWCKLRLHKVVSCRQRSLLVYFFSSVAVFFFGWAV